MKLKNQLLGGFAVVIGVFVLSLAVVGVYLKNLVGTITTIQTETLPFVVVVDEMDVYRSEVQQFLTDVSATHDPAGYKEADEAAKGFVANVGKFRDKFQREGNSQRLTQLEAIATDFDAFYKLGKKMANAYLGQGVEAGNELMKGTDKAPGFDQASEKLKTKLEAFRQQQLDEADQFAGSAVTATTQIVTVLLLGGVLAAAIAGVTALWLARRIVRQLGGEPDEAARLARQVGSGDLTTRIRLQPGDTTSLMASLATMQADLARVVHQVRNGAQSVAEASQQIASGNGDMAQRTSSQAASLEEAAASMEELSSAVENNSVSGRGANEMARMASDVAAKGGVVVKEVVETMEGISDASHKIADIISVIDGIAFQTNILALNAAVEAARAGEQGRGFAVVAGEVRSLAGRSSEAAREIKELITASVGRVAEGTTLVNHAGKTMDEVVHNIERVTQIVGEISTANHEQAAGVAQIGQTITLLDEVTQQNAALVDEMDAAAKALNNQAQELVQAVSVFKLPA
ncbi:MAG TPA: methyl-accepting chemotaxis protein [Burkholderiaceae bacterium]|nr:methyl-accepting chemotaxis protein [Burkholderiaceae bacterium]